MIQKVKNLFLKKYIAKKKGARYRTVTDIEGARTVGILCEIRSEDEYKEIHHLFTSLQNNKRTSCVLGYIDECKVPHYCLEQLTADYISKANLNWYGKPQFPIYQDFIDKDFDILIDFSQKETSALQTILSLSKAKFIVGFLPEFKQLYDLFLNFDLQKNDYNTLLQHIEKYTKQLIGK